MTSRPSRLGAASYEVESSWAEAVDTWGTRLQLLGEPVIPADIQARIAEPITQQYAEEGKLGVRGPWQGSFSVQLALTGQGGTGGTGATSETALYALLKNAIGGGSSDCAGTTVDTSPTSASEFDLVGGTVESGNLIRVGDLGDARGNGQFAAVNNIATTTLLTALDATPNAGDVVYAPLHIYPLESTGLAAITSTRWLLQTANGQWSAKGCFPTSIEFAGLNVGEQPTVTITYGVSRWAEANETFPNATATAAKDGSIVAAGSVFLQDVATVTRQTFSTRSISLTIDLQTQPLMGPGGVDGYQVIVGAVRTKCSASFALTIDAEASGTNTLLDIFTGTALQHCLMTLSATAGKALGLYFPNCRPTNYVTQEAADGLNRRTINFEALTGPTTTSEETMHSWCLAMA
jgi:hypothetical protein